MPGASVPASGEPEKLRGAAGRGDDHLGRRHAGRRHQFEFLLLGVAEDVIFEPGVAAEDDAHAGGVELGEALLQDRVVRLLRAAVAASRLVKELRMRAITVGGHGVAQQAGEIGLVEPRRRRRVDAALGRADVGHRIDVVREHRRDQRVAHLLVAHEMGEALMPGGGELDRVVVIEHVRRDLEAEPCGPRR